MWRKNLWRVLLIAVLMLGVAVPAMADVGGGFPFPPKPECPPIVKPAPIPDPPCPKPKEIWLKPLSGSAACEVQVFGGNNDLNVGDELKFQLQIVQPGNERAVVKSWQLTKDGVVVFSETFGPPDFRPLYYAKEFIWKATAAGTFHFKLEVVYQHRPGTHVVTVDKKYCVNKYEHCEWKYVPCEWEWCWWHWRWELKSAAKYVKVCKTMERICLCEITYQQHTWKESDHADIYVTIR